MTLVELFWSERKRKERSLKRRKQTSKRRFDYPDDWDYARQLIRPIGKEIADELADFFDLEKVDRELARKLMEREMK